MSNTFTKNSLRGFTLIELLVVIAIIGLLSTVIAAPITQARKKGRDGKKVADLHQIVGALQQFADDNTGNFPPNLASTTPVYLAVLPPNASTTAAKDRYMYTVFKTDSDGRYVGFHMGVKLEAPNLSLGDDRDCEGAGAITAADKYCLDSSADAGMKLSGFGSNYTWAATPLTYADDKTVSGAPAATPFANTPASAQDFYGGSDTAGTACTALLVRASAVLPTTGEVCVYDITN
jgi:prepilin-type N-terminal cleavage/methylation domain-containing protein